ncbi:MAG: 4'-phosphopantetheinyl transferase superfamily protein [Gemmatimonadetes bacterium]|nr:4'-phosphopantetheinyl transferase superfamily protein [Gemmatimonadota bacterium]
MISAAREAAPVDTLGGAGPELRLARDEVHVWRARLDQPADTRAALYRSLSSDERARGARLVFDVHRTRFLTARAIQRQILSRYLKTPPDRLGFATSRYGKPRIERPEDARDLRFNASRSGDLVLLAVTRESEVGVDVEADRPIDRALPIARRHFCPAERDALERCPPALRNVVFLRYWTGKEAYVKGVGYGLSLPLDTFDTGLASGPGPARAAGPGPGAPPWDVRVIDAGRGYFAALAVEKRCRRIVSLSWTPDLERSAPDR